MIKKATIARTIYMRNPFKTKSGTWRVESGVQPGALHSAAVHRLCPCTPASYPFPRFSFPKQSLDFVLARKKEGADVEVFTALSQTVETGMERVSFDVISTLNSPRSTFIKNARRASVRRVFSITCASSPYARRAGGRLPGGGPPRRGRRPYPRFWRRDAHGRAFRPPRRGRGRCSPPPPPCG